MPKRSGKAKVAPLRRQRDVNQIARSVADRMIELAEGKPKDPAAVALGRRGGLKGGKARMANMTKDERKALALRAAHARWSKRGRS